jgi:hypothetical protein
MLALLKKETNLSFLFLIMWGLRGNLTLLLASPFTDPEDKLETVVFYV